MCPHSTIDNMDPEALRFDPATAPVPRNRHNRVLQRHDGTIKWGTVWTGVLTLALGAATVGALGAGWGYGKKAVASVSATNGIMKAVGEGQSANRRQDRELTELRRIAQTHEALLKQLNAFMIRDEKWKAEIATTLARVVARK